MWAFVRVSLYRKVFATFFALLNFCYARFGPASSPAPPPPPRSLPLLTLALAPAPFHLPTAPLLATLKHIPASYFSLRLAPDFHFHG